MNKSPAEILAYYLMSQNTFSNPSSLTPWPLFTTTLPTGKNIELAACINDTMSIKDGRLMSGENIIHFGIQVRVRGRTFTEGWMKIMEVASLFEQVHNVSIVIDVDNTYIIHNVSQTSSILPMGQDPETRLFLFSMNFITTIKET
jgi:hypothetical protein